MRTLCLFAAPAALILGGSSQAAVSQSAMDLVREAELHRGVFPDTGIEWTVAAKSEGDTETKEATLLVRTQSGRSLAEITAPSSSKGKKYLLADGSMYFYRPGTSRPVIVPSRQQVAGDAAIGDIASTSFLVEYSPASADSGTHQGERCSVLQLEAKKGLLVSASYSHIKLWISERERLIRKAEFYTKTGRLIRTALFFYKSNLDYDGKTIPFLSSLQVTQQLGTPKTTTLHFSEYKLKSFPTALFSKDSLAGNS